MKDKRVLRAGLWVAVLAGGAAIGLHLRTNRLDLLSPDRGGVYSYADALAGGKSWVAPETGEFGWRLGIHLAPGVAYPYGAIGVKLEPGARAAVFDATGYDSIVLELRSRRQKSVKINVKSFDPGRTDTLRDLSMPLFEGAVGVEREWSRRSIALRDLSIPLWWFQVNGMEPGTRPGWLRNLVGIDLLNGMESPSDLQDTFEVRRLELVGTRWMPLLASLVASLLAIACVESILWRRRRKASISSVSIEARPVELPPRQDVEREALLRWMSENYTREEVGVELAGRATGIHPRKIAGILKTAVGRTFPAHLNEIRLTESARLLRETDRTVSEIALAVGIGNIPHFHRLFKTRFGATPKEWRSQGANPGA